MRTYGTFHREACFPCHVVGDKGNSLANVDETELCNWT